MQALFFRCIIFLTTLKCRTEGFSVISRHSSDNWIKSPHPRNQLQEICLNFFPSFLGALAKFRKATVSFVMTIPLSVRVKQLGSQWTDFDKI